MTRETYIRDLAYNVMVDGVTTRWDTATDEERAEAQVIIDRLSGCVHPPEDAPVEHGDVYSMWAASIPKAMAATV